MLPETVNPGRPARGSRTPSRRVAALVGAGALVAATLAAAPVASAAAGTPAAAAHASSGRQHAGEVTGGHVGSRGHHGSRAGYLALGDSVAFGYRPPQVTPPADYLDASNFVGYPEVISRWTGVRLADASCPGETTASFLDVTAQSNGCENSVGSPAGYRTAFPLHVDYPGDQMTYAVHYLRHHRNVRLVSIDIGANDLFVCQETTADQCTGSDFTDTVTTVTKNLDTILSRLRHRAGYHHTIVVLSYYSLDYGDQTATAGIHALNAGLARAAQAHHAAIAAGFTAFRRASASSDGDTCAAGLIIRLPDGSCNVHPTRAGHRLLAKAVLRAARG